MSARRTGVIMSLIVLLAASLQLGLWVTAHDLVRLTLAFLVIVLLPGLGWLVALGTRPAGGSGLAPAWALPIGVAWAGLLVWGCHLTGIPFTRLIVISGGLAVLPWVAAWRLAPREPQLVPTPEPKSIGASIAIALAAIVAALHSALLGTPLTLNSDSPDHIGTIRRMLESGNAFPTDAFFRDAGAAGADPRKGLWHPVVAWIAGTAGVDPVVAWRGLPMLLSPLFVLNAAALGALLRGPRTAAFAAWALLLTYGGSLASPYLRESVFSTKLADQFAFAVIAALLMDLARPSARIRMTVVALLLGAVLTHVFAVIHLGVVGGALALGLVIRDGWRSIELKRLASTASLAVLAVVPFLAWRMLGAYAPGNIIHLEPQGLLEVGRGLRTVSPGVLWDWMGLAWLVLPASVLAMWRHAWKTPVLLLLTTTVAVIVLLFFPPVVMVLQPKLGYLLMRFVWILPLSVALAFALDVTLLRLNARSWWSRTIGVLTLAGLAVVLRAPIEDAVLVMLDPERWRAQERAVSGPAWTDAMGWMDRNLPEGTVILSDPATSYLVPMMTRHHVATLLDQHSSPNDPHALDRILDARDALDPHGSWSRAREVFTRWGVTTIALNGRFAVSPGLDYWSPDAAWFRAASARLDRESAAFPRLWACPDFVVYGIDRAVLDTLSTAVEPRPGLRSLEPGESARVPRVGEDVDLVSFSLSRRHLTPGDTLLARFEWHVRSPRPVGQYDLFARFDRAVPADGRSHPLLAKPMRKLIERRNGERYRFRFDHTPTGGSFGVDRWLPGTVVSDSLAIVIPFDVAPGAWQVQVRLRRQPHYPNYRLRDYFADRDYYSGVPVDSIWIGRRDPERGGE